MDVLSALDLAADLLAVAELHAKLLSASVTTSATTQDKSSLHEDANNDLFLEKVRQLIRRLSNKDSHALKQYSIVASAPPLSSNVVALRELASNYLQDCGLEHVDSIPVKASPGQTQALQHGIENAKVQVRLLLQGRYPNGKIDRLSYGVTHHTRTILWSVD